MLFIRISAEPISKAVGGSQQPSASVDTETEDQSSAEYESSYARRYEGVASGNAARPDYPERGKRWKEGESVLDQVRESRKERTKADKDDGVIKSEEYEAALSILDGLNKAFEAVRKVQSLNQLEREYLIDYGYSEDEVKKGLVSVRSPFHRKQFTEWLCVRLQKGLGGLVD